MLLEVFNYFFFYWFYCCCFELLNGVMKDFFSFLFWKIPH